MADDEIQERPGPKAPEPSPRRVIPLRDLAARANMCGSAAQTNQALLQQQLLPPEQKLPPAVVAAGQLIASAIFHCTLAICERLDSRDVPELAEEIDKSLQEQNGKLN